MIIGVILFLSGIILGYLGYALLNSKTVAHTKANYKLSEDVWKTAQKLKK